MSQSCKIGAYWKMDPAFIGSIAKKYNPNSLRNVIIPSWIAISKDGLLWTGGNMDHGPHSADPVDSYDLKCPGNAFLLKEKYDTSYWDSLRVALINGDLGEPTWGINPLVGITKHDTVCICSSLDLLWFAGCPSSHGGKCRSK